MHEQSDISVEENLEQSGYRIYCDHNNGDNYHELNYELLLNVIKSSETMELYCNQLNQTGKCLLRGIGILNSRHLQPKVVKSFSKSLDESFKSPLPADKIISFVW